MKHPSNPCCSLLHAPLLPCPLLPLILYYNTSRGTSSCRRRWPPGRTNTFWEQQKYSIKKCSESPKNKKNTMTIRNKKAHSKNSRRTHPTRIRWAPHCPPAKRRTRRSRGTQQPRRGARANLSPVYKPPNNNAIRREIRTAICTLLSQPRTKKDAAPAFPVTSPPTRHKMPSQTSPSDGFSERRTAFSCSDGRRF